MPMQSTATIRENVNRRGYPTSESALAALWQNSHALVDGLVAQDGRRFRVLYPGRPNPRAGPDFHDAVLLKEDGEVVKGDVELHLNAPDWYAHGHNTDPNYNGVILHVVLHPKSEISTSQRSGLRAPVVSLLPIAASLDHLEEQSPIESLSDLQSLDKVSILRRLESAGDRRFLAKSRGFAMELENDEAAQVLYRALLEALGYASNRRAFRTLAERVPLDSFASLKHEPDSTRLLALRAMLVAGAGLMAFVESSEAQSLVRILKQLPSVKAMSSDEWRLFRVRPTNHPVARIEGAARLIDRFLTTGLVSGLEELVSGNDARLMIENLTAQPFIGKGRAGDMAVNVVLPCFHAYARIRKSEALRRRSVEIYEAFPKLQDNEITREMRRLLPALSANRISTARQQQGLIQLYKEVTRSASAAAL
ncbi:MAG: DUF2851 family protein [Ardenticatenaceae bacterium]